MKKRNRGYSLVEMVVVITVGTVLMGIAVTMLGALLHASAAMNGHVRHITTVRRLAEQFRDDAHAAVSTQSLDITGLEDGEDASGRSFELASDHIVTYEFRSGSVDRIEEVDRNVRSRESFVLPNESVASTATDDDSNTTIVALVISPATNAAAPANITPMRIEAVLAKDHRFAKPE